MKTTACIVALIIGVSISPAAQTLTEQLQKGIYTEETLKNREEAARIYRQILAAPSVPDSISAEAQRRLARLLIPQPKAKPPVPKPEEARVEPPLERGLVENGRYRHVASEITFDLPPGWSAGMTFPSSDDGDMVGLTDGTRSINVWMIKEATPADQVAARVAGAPAEKVRQRHSGYTIPGMSDAGTYQIDPDTVKPMMLNGRFAIVAIGSYLGLPMDSSQRTAGPSQMREYMTWIYTQQSRAFFFARVPVDDLPTLRLVFEQIVNSAVIP
jgi:hypothetical protein